MYVYLHVLGTCMCMCIDLHLHLQPMSYVPSSWKNEAYNGAKFENHTRAHGTHPVTIKSVRPTQSVRTECRRPPPVGQSRLSVSM